MMPGIVMKPPMEVTFDAAGAPHPHAWQHRLDHRDRAKHVGVELLAYVVQRRFLQDTFMAVAGIVDEDVDRTDRALCLGNGLPGMASKSVTSRRTACARSGAIALKAFAASWLRSVPMT
jgi:hypothetical protein